MLLGLLREGQGLGARALATLGVQLEDVREQVAQIIGQGEEVGAGQIPFTPRAKRVLELSLREALSLGHNYIGTEHLLLGLARENDGVAARILLDFGADADTIRDQVVAMLSGAGRVQARPVPVPSRARRHHRLRPAYLPLLVGWALFGAALGIGILIGWAIWS